MRIRNPLIGVLSLGLMVACSGGGSGGPAPQAPSQLSLSVSPTTISYATSTGSTEGGTYVYLTASNWQAQTELYFYAYCMTGIVDNVNYSTSPSADGTVTATVTYQVPWWLGSGNYSDTLRFVVSTDPEGQNPITGSPISIPVSYSVSGPAITSLTPGVVKAGDPAFTLTINGTGFQQGSPVIWNGTQLAATYVSPTTYTAQVPASAIATAGNGNVYLSTFEGESNYFDLQALPPGTSQPVISPTSAFAGGPGFTLTFTCPPLQGYALDAYAELQWNGHILPSTLGRNGLTAQVPASAIATAGTAEVYLTNGSGGWGLAWFEFPILAPGSAMQAGNLASPASAPGPSSSLHGNELHHWFQAITNH